jgi:sarcosine oxidase gamma subunit
VIFAYLWREAPDDFTLYPHRSFARAMLEALEKAGAEFGVVIDAD